MTDRPRVRTKWCTRPEKNEGKKEDVFDSMGRVCEFRLIDSVTRVRHPWSVSPSDPVRGRVTDWGWGAVRSLWDTHPRPGIRPSSPSRRSE